MRDPLGGLLGAVLGRASLGVVGMVIFLAALWDAVKSMIDAWPVTLFLGSLLFLFVLPTLVTKARGWWRERAAARAPAREGD